MIAWSGSYPGYSLFETVDTAAPASSFNVTGLTPGQSYTFAVVTYNAGGTLEVFNIPDMQPEHSAQATATAP